MKRVEGVLAELESARRRLLSEVEGVHEPRFSTTPAAGKWSVGHVIEHLARTEEGITRGVTAVCAGKLKVERKGSDWMGRLVYVSGLYRIVSVRTIERLNPEAGLERGAALARLAGTREELKAAIESGERRGLWSHSLRHPFFGPLAMLEMIEFAAYHEERHRRQIVRIKRALELARK